MQYEVYHAQSRDTRFEHNPASWTDRRGDYGKVAEVEATGLDQVYQNTNNIEHAWTENDGVKPFGNEHRSTSVGDVIVVGDKAYMVAGFGFTEIGVEVEYECTVKVKVRTHQNMEENLHFRLGWELEQKIPGFQKDSLKVVVKQ